MNSKESTGEGFQENVSAVGQIVMILDGVDAKICPVEPSLLYTKKPFTHISQSSSLAPYSPAFHSRKRRASACLPRLARFQPTLRRILVLCIAAGLVLRYRRHPRQHTPSLKGGLPFTTGIPIPGMKKPIKKSALVHSRIFLLRTAASGGGAQICSTTCHFS